MRWMKMWLVLGILVIAGAAAAWQMVGTRTITLIVPTPMPTVLPTPTIVPIKSISLEVPYTVQAPSGQWADERFQDACEEVNAIMAMAWAKNSLSSILSKAEVEKEVVAIEDYEVKNYKSTVDTSAADTAERVVKGYFNYKNVEVKTLNSIEDIVRELVLGKIVITPMNGQIINNLHYKQPGPARHMILVKGYDLEKKEFITNDSGMKDGVGYRYPEKVFFDGIRDYPSGDHAPIVGVVKKMIVVSR